MTINIREFTRNIYKYLSPGEYVVTRNGKEPLIITINVATSVVLGFPKVPENVVTNGIEVLDRVMTYSTDVVTTIPAEESI